MRRALELADRWKVNAAIYGGQAGYEMAGEIAAKKMPVLVNLKWPEAEKDADPDQTPTLRTLRLRDRAPSTPAAFTKAGVKFAFYSGDTANPKDLLKAVKKSIDAADAEILPGQIIHQQPALRGLVLDHYDMRAVIHPLRALSV